MYLVAVQLVYVGSIDGAFEWDLGTLHQFSVRTFVVPRTHVFAYWTDPQSVRVPGMTSV